jgi:trk system potassium uptake protein TrkH
MALLRRFSFLRLNPAQSIVCGYLMYAVISAIILRQPFFHKVDISIIDNFFTSVSAVTATGLVSLNVASSYTFWGQMFILISHPDRWYWLHDVQLFYHSCGK